jgi:hypothetical protein
VWCRDILHLRDERRVHDSIDRLAFCDTDIEEVFLKGQFTIFYLEFSDVVAFRGIQIQDPDVVDAKSCDQRDEDDINLSKGKSKIFPSGFSLRKKWDMSLFRYQDVRIHATNV